jgi:hypothetical protein
LAGPDSTIALGSLRDSTFAFADRTARRVNSLTGQRLLDYRFYTSAVAGQTNILFKLWFFSSHCDTTPAMGIHQLHFDEIAQAIVRSNLERFG